MQAKHKLRLKAAKLLDPVLPYTSYSINESEYLGQFDGSLEECVGLLEENGYHYQLFAAIKELNGETDDGSFARLAEEHPPEAEDTALDQERHPKECQYHVHLFDRGEHVDLYGHYEVSPYPHVPHWDIERAWPDHYRPTWDREDRDRKTWSYLRGVLGSQLAEQL